MERELLQEAFKLLEGLDSLTEDSINITNVDDLLDDFIKSYVDLPEVEEEEIKIIDPEAATEDDVEDSYAGKVILDCCVCHSKIYKDPSEVEVDEDGNVVNSKEECPYCYSTDGFKVIGQVDPIDIPEVGEDDSVNLGDVLNNSEDITDDITDADSIDSETDGLDEDFHNDKRYQRPRGLKEATRKPESIYDKIKAAGILDEGGNELKEELQSATLETDSDIINVSNDGGSLNINASPKEESTVGEEVISPLSNEVKDEIESNSEEAPVEDEFTDVDIEDVDEDSFDNVTESYLKEAYNNVSSYKTSKITESKNTLIVEGVIKFNSGKEKATKFVYEPISIDKNNNLKLRGINESISDKKAFTLNATCNNKKMISESLKYRYRAKSSSGNLKLVEGLVKR